MWQSSITRVRPDELVAAAFSLPLFSLFVSIVIIAGWLIVVGVRRRRTGQGATGAKPLTPSRLLTERRVLSAGALAVIVAYAIENVVRGYLLNLADIVEWWQYATPLFAACVCLTVMLGFLSLGGGSPSGQPVVSLARRTWTSFNSLSGLLSVGAASFALIATTVAAGMASSPDNRGRYILLAIPVPNVPIDALRPWFYGWAYGIPVLLCLAALMVITWATLRRNSLRPFLGPETVVAEKRVRVEVATGVVRIATASMLLALGGAFRFIDSAGSIMGLQVGGDGGRNDSYELSWRYAEFAVAAGWLAPILEITAFLLLILVATRTPIGDVLRRRPDARSAQGVLPESVR